MMMMMMMRMSYIQIISVVCLLLQHHDAACAIRPILSLSSKSLIIGGLQESSSWSSPSEQGAGSWSFNVQSAFHFHPFQQILQSKKTNSSIVGLIRMLRGGGEDDTDTVDVNEDGSSPGRRRRRRRRHELRRRRRLRSPHGPGDPPRSVWGAFAVFNFA